MQVTFLLKDNRKLTWQVPEQAPVPFNFPGMILALRSHGFITTENLYVSGEEIIAIKLEETHS